MLAYVGSIQTLKDLKTERSALVRLIPFLSWRGAVVSANE